ncbi:hypothetical protein ACOSQ2_013485 [Xanthoceras sorbifolium]
MGKLKAWIIFLCLALISMAFVNQVQVGAVKYIDPRVLDPCKRSGASTPGCGHNKNTPPQQANEYNRGCSAIHRCRGN